MVIKKIFSVVVPVYNEADCIVDFLNKELFPVLDKINRYDVELIIVDDGSSDGTLMKLKKIIEKDEKRKKIKIISFSKNFGKEAALSAGLKYATGDAVLTIDSDGQQPPKLIEEFLKKWEDGADVVVGVREKYSKHGLIAKIGSKIFYKILDKISGERTVPGATDFRLLDRVVVDEYNELTEHNRIARGLIDWLGYRQEYIEYVYGERMAGKPSYDLKKLFRLAIDSFVSLSVTPLIVFGYVGIFITISSFILGLFVIIQQYILGDPLGLYWNGAVQMAIFITFLVGLVLISQAITALYISHIHAETQNRPLYIVDRKKSINFNEETVNG
ncbi:glycosyltransferase [Candidatus Saccharibacteria bacterium]|nr:glycosyltransferase [Candidatus Saccharibacteria bacterium]